MNDYRITDSMGDITVTAIDEKDARRTFKNFRKCNDAEIITVIQVNVSSSWIVYITKTHDEAIAIHKFAMTQKEILGDDWYYHVSTADIKKDCRVPEFFHDHGSCANTSTSTPERKRRSGAARIRAQQKSGASKAHFY